MPRLVAKSALRYASHDLKAGDEFEASESDAFVLKNTGKAHDAKVATAAAKSEDGVSEPERPARQPRRYSRADMRAKE